MLYSKGAADDVTARPYSSKAEQQKAEKDWLQTQVDKDAASYWKSKEQEQAIEGMEIDGKRDKGSDNKAIPRCLMAAKFRNELDPTGEQTLNHWIKQGQIQDLSI